MNILIVEDDYLCREVLRRYMQPHGTCNIVINGREAVDAFKTSLVANERYDLVCLDIMMPELSGQEVLKEIRAAESEAGISGLDRSKVIMTTALSDASSVMTAFRGECDGYLVKPISKDAILKLFKQLGIGPAQGSAARE
jgi:two-component system chemotaxis response regulator CheY